MSKNQTQSRLAERYALIEAEANRLKDVIRANFSGTTVIFTTPGKGGTRKRPYSPTDALILKIGTLGGDKGTWIHGNAKKFGLSHHHAGGYRGTLHQFITLSAAFHKRFHAPTPKPVVTPAFNILAAVQPEEQLMQVSAQSA